MGLSVSELRDAQPLPSPSPRPGWPGGGNKLVFVATEPAPLWNTGVVVAAFWTVEQKAPTRRSPWIKTEGENVLQAPPVH